MPVPYPFDDTKSEAIRSYCKPLLEARERAQDNPLKPGLVFPLKLRCEARSTPYSRPLPWFANKEDVYSSELLQALQEGPDKYSQVWVASVQPVEALEGNSPSKSAKIVLKILQPSLLYLPDSDYAWRETYVNPEELPGNEDLAYSELTGIQGIFIPYHFGKQQACFSPFSSHCTSN